MGPDDLLGFVTNVAGIEGLRVERELGGGFYRLNIGEAERRQAKHDVRSIEDAVIELVRNSRDAGADSIFIASAKNSAKTRTVTIFDNGAGIPAEFHRAVFEPRVTSKIDSVIEDRYGIHGRGMALYSIRSNADSIKLLKSEHGRGSVFSISCGPKSLAERKDQSTFPKLAISTANKIRIVTGPHNIWRLLVEVSLDAPGIDIFYGSPAEILATLAYRARNRSELEATVWGGLCRTETADALSREAAPFGLTVSPRTCRRILGGAIEPVDSINETLRKIAPSGSVIKKRGKKSKIDEDDLEAFAKVVGEKFRNVGQKYFLRLEGRPRVTCTAKRIRIELFIEHEGW